MTGRVFVVTVSESPARVVVEDVRSRERVVAADVPDVGAQIARWLTRATTGEVGERHASASPASSGRSVRARGAELR